MEHKDIQKKPIKEEQLPYEINFIEVERATSIAPGIIAWFGLDYITLFNIKAQNKKEQTLKLEHKNVTGIVPLNNRKFASVSASGTGSEFYVWQLDKKNIPQKIDQRSLFSSKENIQLTRIFKSFDNGKFICGTFYYEAESQGHAGIFMASVETGNKQMFICKSGKDINKRFADSLRFDFWGLNKLIVKEGPYELSNDPYIAKYGSTINLLDINTKSNVWMSNYRFMLHLEDVASLKSLEVSPDSEFLLLQIKPLAGDTFLQLRKLNPDETLSKEIVRFESEEYLYGTNHFLKMSSSMIFRDKNGATCLVSDLFSPEAEILSKTITTRLLVSHGDCPVGLTTEIGFTCMPSPVREMVYDQLLMDINRDTILSDTLPLPTAVTQIILDYNQNPRFFSKFENKFEKPTLSGDAHKLFDKRILTLINKLDEDDVDRIALQEFFDLKKDSTKTMIDCVNAMTTTQSATPELQSFFDRLKEQFSPSKKITPSKKS